MLNMEIHGGDFGVLDNSIVPDKNMYNPAPDSRNTEMSVIHTYTKQNSKKDVIMLTFQFLRVPLAVFF
jgi:hypothetical protein